MDRERPSLADCRACGGGPLGALGVLDILGICAASATEQGQSLWGMSDIFDFILMSRRQCKYNMFKDHQAQLCKSEAWFDTRTWLHVQWASKVVKGWAGHMLLLPSQSPREQQTWTSGTSPGGIDMYGLCHCNFQVQLQETLAAVC